MQRQASCSREGVAAPSVPSFSARGPLVSEPPNLPPPLAAELARPTFPINIPLNNAVAACNAVAHGPARQVAEVAALLLEKLQQRYLAGGELLGSTVRDAGSKGCLQGGHDGARRGSGTWRCKGCWGCVESRLLLVDPHWCHAAPWRSLSP